MAAQSPSPRVFHVKQAAVYLGISEKAIRSLITQGRLPYIQRKPGNSPFLIDRLDLDRWIEASKTPATRI